MQNKKLKVAILFKLINYKIVSTVIKAIKANMPDMNLVSAKKFVEALPKVLRQDVDKEEAEKIMEIFKAEGATVEMK